MAHAPFPYLEAAQVSQTPCNKLRHIIWIQKGLASLSTLLASAQVLLKSNALDLISLQLRLIKCYLNEYL